jgi:hypothetical protein
MRIQKSSFLVIICLGLAALVAAAAAHGQQAPRRIALKQCLYRFAVSMRAACDQEIYARQTPAQDRPLGAKPIISGLPQLAAAVTGIHLRHTPPPICCSNPELAPHDPAGT